MSRKHPKSEERAYTSSGKTMSFVFYSILPECCPVLLEPKVHGEGTEKQTRSETEKEKE